MKLNNSLVSIINKTEKNLEQKLESTAKDIGNSLKSGMDFVNTNLNDAKDTTLLWQQLIDAQKQHCIDLNSHLSKNNGLKFAEVDELLQNIRIKIEDLEQKNSNLNGEKASEIGKYTF